MRIERYVNVATTAVPAFTDLSHDYNADKNMIEKAIENAIQNTIVIPFKEWCAGIWASFMCVSHYLCLYVAIGGVILLICGIKKGKKVAIIAGITYLGLLILNAIILG